jgi:uncharacterized YigZ family protein
MSGPKNKAPAEQTPILFTLAGNTTYEEEIRKSRFIVKAAKVANPLEALAFLEQVREVRAAHNCWAYKVGEKYRFSDDGEPGGTAGRPMLNAIEKQNIDGVMVVVIRYFGGVKLGAGGLARAYGGCVAKCLQQARLERIVPKAQLRLRVAFDHIGALYNLVDQFGAKKIDAAYTDTGLEIELEIDRTACQPLMAALSNASAGRIELLFDG